MGTVRRVTSLEERVRIGELAKAGQEETRPYKHRIRQPATRVLVEVHRRFALTLAAGI